MAEELKVIGAGCGRTGTSSLREALKTLGYNPYHMEECVRNDHFRLWLRAGRGDGAALDAALRGYDATTDFPAATFVDELVRRHPAAKVVLSTRDAGDWARSVRATIWHPHFLEKHWLFRLLLGKRAQDMCRMYRERFFGGAEPSPGDVDALKRAFRAHEARVRRTVPADRLLVHRATDGWAPLCAFLGKPIPDAPYPRVNDAASFRRHIHLVQAFLVVLYSGLVVAAGYVVRLWRSPVISIFWHAKGSRTAS